MPASQGMEAERDRAPAKQLLLQDGAPSPRFHRPRYPGESRFRRVACPAPPAAPGASLRCSLPSPGVRPGRAGRRRKVSPAPRPPAPPRRPRYEPLSSAPALPMVAERGALRPSGPPRQLSKAQVGVPTARGTGWSRAAGAARLGSPRRPAMRPRREMLKPP